MRWSIAHVLALVSLTACAPTRVQSWNYRTYDYVPTRPSELGYVELVEREGKYTMTIVAKGLATCYSAPLDAEVEETASTLVITPSPRIPSCERFRYVLRKDGTGGSREQWDGKRWVPEKRDRLLTKRQ